MPSESDRKLTLGPDQVIELDLEILGSTEFVWPVPFEPFHDLLPALGESLVAAYLANPDALGWKILYTKRSLTRWLTTWLYLRQVQYALRQEPRPGLRLVKEIPRLQADNSHQAIVSRHEKHTRAKQWLARTGQVALLRLFDLFRLPRPLLRISTMPVPERLTGRWTYRVRNPYSFLDCGAPLSLEERGSLTEAAAGFQGILAQHCLSSGLELPDADFRDVVQFLLMPHLEGGLRDYTYARKVVGSRPLDCAFGCLAGYTAAIFSMAAHDAGGQVHATQHADYHFRIVNIFTLTDLINAASFHCKTEEAAQRLRRASAAHSQDFSGCRIESLEPPGYAPPPLEAPPWRGRVETVMVMGVLATPELPRANLVTPVVLDFEIRLCRKLVEWGYRVIYKAHPENSWNGHQALFGPEVEVISTPFEKVWSRADAYLILLAQSTTTQVAWRTDRPIFYFWQSRLEPFDAESVPWIERRCEVIPLTFDERNRGMIEFERLRKGLANPRPLDKEAREELGR